MFSIDIVTAQRRTQSIPKYLSQQPKVQCYQFECQSQMHLPYIYINTLTNKEYVNTSDIIYHTHKGVTFMIIPFRVVSKYSHCLTRLDYLGSISDVMQYFDGLAKINSHTGITAD